MAIVFTLSNGENVTLLSSKDIPDVIERFCGYDFAKYVGGILSKHDDTEQIISDCLCDINERMRMKSINNHMTTLNLWIEDSLEKITKELNSINISSAKDTVTISTIKRLMGEIKKFSESMYQNSEELYDYISEIHNNF